MAKQTRTSFTLAIPLLLLVPASTPVAAGAQTGTISGTVTLEPPPPPRRSADPYARGAAAAHEIQTIPAVAYLKGAIAGSAPRPATVRMEQRDTSFTPPAVFVQAGGAVEFPNADSFFHNVFSYSPTQRFDLGRYGAGESKSVTFPDPGVVNVFCEVHDFMRGLIVVTRNPFHAEVGDDGAFRLEGVPAGEHVLVVLHPDHESTERTVTVRAGAVTTVEVELGR